MRFRIGTKIALGFSLVIILFLIVGITSYTQIKKLETAMNDIVINQIERMQITDDVRFNFSQKINNIRAYIISHDESFATKYHELAATNKLLEQKLIDLAATEQGKLLAQALKNDDEKYNRIIETQMIPLIQAGNQQEIIRVMNEGVVPLATETFATAKELVEWRDQQMHEKTNVAVNAANQAITLNFILSLVAIIAVIVITIILTLLITKPLKTLNEGALAIAGGDLTKLVDIKTKDEIGELTQTFNKMSTDLRDMTRQIIDTAQNLFSTSEELSASSEETAAASEQVTKTITQLATGASESAKSVGETNQVISGMFASTQEVAASAETVSESSIRAAKAAREGVNQADNAVKKIKQIETVAAQTSQAINKLGEESKQIGKIVDVIKGIADQTNLLALNAAIEAARAGDQGRGFAVVAEEVRKLAEQSSASAQQIAELIGSIQKETERAVNVMARGSVEVAEGVEVVNAAGSAFKIIVTEIDQVSQQIQQVAAAAQHMASAANQAVESVTTIAAITEETAASTEEVSAAAQEQMASIEAVAGSAQDLAKLGEGLRLLVAKFKV